jgi:hypothetical protein
MRYTLSPGKSYKVLPLWPVYLDFVTWSLVIEDIFGPRRQLLVSLVQVPAVVAESSWASRTIADSPYGSSPHVAVCTSPRLSLAGLELEWDLHELLIGDLPFLKPTFLSTVTRSCSRSVAADWAQTPKPSLLLASFAASHVLLLFDIIEEFVLGPASHVGR